MRARRERAYRKLIRARARDHAPLRYGINKERDRRVDLSSAGERKRCELGYIICTRFAAVACRSQVWSRHAGIDPVDLREDLRHVSSLIRHDVLQGGRSVESRRVEVYGDRSCVTRAVYGRRAPVKRVENLCRRVRGVNRNNLVAGVVSAARVRSRIHPRDLSLNRKQVCLAYHCDNVSGGRVNPLKTEVVLSLAGRIVEGAAY